MLKTKYKGLDVIYDAKKRHNAWIAFYKNKKLSANQLFELKDKIDKAKEGKIPKRLTQLQVNNRLKALLKRRRYIESIKFCKEHLKLELMEAKIYVDELKEGMKK
jgi:hypothetical protein